MRNLWGGRRSAKWIAGVAGAVVLLVGTSGCAAEPAPAPTSSSSSSPTPAGPVFASDEEALAAATEAYANYQAMADRIDSEGGREPERIAPYVSTTYLPTAIEDFTGFQEANARSIGVTKFRVHEAQQLDYSDPEETSISVYICDDVSEVDVVDENGVSLVSESRNPITPFEVGFVLDETRSLVIGSRAVWEGTNFC